MNKTRYIIFWSVIILLISVSILGYSLLEWFDMRFGIGLEALLFTLTSPLEGSDASFLEEAILYMKPSIVFTVQMIACASCVCFLLNRVNVKIAITIKKHKIQWDFYRICQCFMLMVAIVCLYNTVSYCEETLHVTQFVSRKLDKTTIYEEYYVKPDKTTVVSGAKKKNVICIYMESMESAYASKEVGGAMEDNYIPNLTTYAQESVSFSDNNKLGGSSPISSSSYTMAALLATTSGVSYL